MRRTVVAFAGSEAASTGASLLSLATILFLVGAGHLGSRDPLANPLPLFVWTVWWIGFTYLHALFGNLCKPVGLPFEPTRELRA